MMRSLLLLALAATTASCFGGLDNRPFEPGAGGAELKGTLMGPIDTTRAYVALVDHPGLMASVDTQGRFAFSSTLAPGAYDLAASTGMGHATRRSITLYAMRTLNLALEPELGATVHGQVRTDVTSTSAAIVRLDMLPVETASSPTTGTFELDSLPPGPIAMIVSELGFGSVTVDLDLASGSSTTTEVHLRAQGAGVCSACTSDHQCASRTCGSFQSTHYMTIEQSCVSPCGHTGTCDPGFRCTPDLTMHTRSVCVPVSTTCAAFVSLLDHSSCTADAMCGMGIQDGICRSQQCTVTCFAGQVDCPFGTSCVVDHQDPNGRCQ
jgi:hypothetical protein